MNKSRLVAWHAICLYKFLQPIVLLWSTISATDVANLTTVGVWLGIIAFVFRIYFDFSGYSDMAIGLGKMFGFEFIENFNYPYISKSVISFGFLLPPNFLVNSKPLSVCTHSTLKGNAPSICSRKILDE